MYNASKQASKDDFILQGLYEDERALREAEERIAAKEAEKAADAWPINKAGQEYVNKAVNAQNKAIDKGADAMNGAVEKLTEGAGETGIFNPPKPLSLSNTETRRWYLGAESQIPSQIDRTKPLEQQARQASALRNQVRTQAREAMTNRELANSLFGSRPNMTWEEAVDKYSKLGLSGDELYEEIMKAATRSNPQVNELLKVFPK